MVYQIDQSGKVEDTQKLTVAGLANGKAKTLLISAVEKRKLLKTMRAFEYPKKTFVFRIFAGLIFLLIENEEIESLIIDTEYPQHEADVKFFLLLLFRKNKKQLPEISFAQIGRKAKARKTALAVFQKKQKPDMVMRADDVWGLFYG